MPTVDERASFWRVTGWTTIPWVVGVAALLAMRPLTAGALPGSVRGALLRGVLPAALGILATIACEMKRSGSSLSAAAHSLGLTRFDARQLRIALVATLPIVAAYAIAFGLLKVSPQTEPGLPLVMLKFAVAQGVAEELLFRAFAFRLLREGRTFGRAALLSAVLFALVHVTNLLKGFTFEIVIGMAVSTVYAFFMAFPLAKLYERGRGALWGCALLHFFIDSNNWFPALSESIPGVLVYVFVGTFGSLGLVLLQTREASAPADQPSIVLPS